MASINERIRGLYLSAVDLRNLTNWPMPVIEDYLSILDSLLLFSESVDTGASISIKFTNGNYIAQLADGVILLNAFANPITCSLPLSSNEGQEHSIKCVDNTFACFIDPQGKDIDGDAGIIEIYLHESITVKADSDGDWWII